MQNINMKRGTRVCYRDALGTHTGTVVNVKKDGLLTVALDGVSGLKVNIYIAAVEVL